MSDKAKKEDMELQVEDRKFTEEETKSQMKMFEGDMIEGLIAAADYRSEETQLIEIVRNGKLYFSFKIRPLNEQEYSQCKKKHTKYVRNKQLGIKMPEDTDNAKYRCALIYQATIQEDRDKLWDNRRVWTSYSDKGFQVMTALDVIEYALISGEKEKIIEHIDLLSGYEDNLEEIAKN